MKKLVAIVLSLVLVLSLVACQSNDDLVQEQSPTVAAAQAKAEDSTDATETTESAEAAAEETEEKTEEQFHYVDTITKRQDDKSVLPAGTGRTIAMITPVMGMTFSLIQGTAAYDAVREGDEFLLYSYEWDVDTFMSQMESLVIQGVDGVIILSNESEVATTVARVAEDAKIPVVVVENPIADSSVVHATVSGDNYGMGWEIGNALAEGVFNKTGSYEAEVLTYFPLNTGIAQTRYKGFEDAIAQYEGLKVCYNIEGDASADVALPLIESALSAHPETTAYACSFDPAAIAAVQAFDEAGRDDIVIVTNECTNWVSEQIRSGRVYAGIDTGPYTTGYNGVCVLYNILDGVEYFNQYYILPVKYTAENLDNCATWQIEKAISEKVDITFMT